MTLKKLLYPPADMCADIDRMAAEIQHDFGAGEPDSFALIGLYKQGVPLAERICDVIEHRTGRRPRLGKLDISMYRDDVGLRSGLPLIRETVIPFDVTGTRLILVGDADGVVVIPRKDARELLEAARKNLAGEQEEIHLMKEGLYTEARHRETFTTMFLRHGGSISD